MAEYVRTVDHATSVKKIRIIEEPTQTKSGMADFEYNPVFSVFDIGTIMPPVLLDNSTICLMAGYNFELLKGEGIESHYIGLVNNDQLITADEAIKNKEHPAAMRVHFVNRIKPDFIEGKGWDYSKFRGQEANNYVQPMEFISRNDLPSSSSVWGRVERGEITLQDLGLPEGFVKGDPVPDGLKPILDYSTKFEPDDVYHPASKVQNMLGISPARFAGINNTTRKASNLMTDYAASRGFTREDGKVEYVVLPDFVMTGKSVEEGDVRDYLGDAVCTWHEDRLVYNGIGISKQRIRDKVKQLNPEWVAEIKRAKAEAKQNRIEDFRTLMDPEITYVSPNAAFFSAINKLFRAATNQWVGARVYDVYPEKDENIKDSLERAIEEFQAA